MGTRQRSGLHKDISSIFDGVPVPDSTGGKDYTKNVSRPDSEARHLPPVVGAVESGAPSAKPVEKIVQQKTPSVKIKKPSAAGQAFEQLKAKLLTPPEGVSPAKHKATLVMIPALLVIVVAVFGRNFISAGGGVKGTSETQENIEIAAVAPKTEIQWQKPLLYPENLRDPMTRYSSFSGTETAVSGDIVVRGIAWSSDKPAAVIGTKIMYVGDAIQGATIKKIMKDGVEFESEGKTWIQKVGG